MRRGLAINQRLHQNTELSEYERSVPYSCFFQLSLGTSLALDPRNGMRGLGGKAGSACEEFEDNEGGILG